MTRHTHLPRQVGRDRRAGAAAALLALVLSSSGCSLMGTTGNKPQAPAPSVSQSPPATPTGGTKAPASRPRASGSAHVPGFVPPQMLVPAMDTYTQESAGGEVFAAAWSTARAGRSKQLVRALSYANRHLLLNDVDLDGGAVRLTGQGQAEDIAAATGDDAFADSGSTVIYTIDVVPAPAAKLTMVRVIATVLGDVEPVTSDSDS